MEGIMAEGKAYYKDYDVEIPETLSAYGYGDSPLTFVSLSDYNGMRKLQGMDSVDLLENNYRISNKLYMSFWLSFYIFLNVRKALFYRLYGHFAFVVNLTYLGLSSYIFAIKRG